MIHTLVRISYNNFDLILLILSHNPLSSLSLIPPDHVLFRPNRSRTSLRHHYRRTQIANCETDWRRSRTKSHQRHCTRELRTATAARLITIIAHSTLSGSRSETQRQRKLRWHNRFVVSIRSTVIRCERPVSRKTREREPISRPIRIDSQRTYAKQDRTGDEAIAETNERASHRACTRL